MNYQGLQIMEQKNAVLRSLKMLIEHMSAETLRGLSVLAFLEPYDLQASSLQTSFMGTQTMQEYRIATCFLSLLIRF